MTRKTELIRKLHDRSPRNRYAEAEAEARAGHEILIKQYGSEGKLANEVRARIWPRVRRADTAKEAAKFCAEAPALNRNASDSVKK
jgi:hypothetical protein